MATRHRRVAPTPPPPRAGPGGPPGPGTHRGPSNCHRSAERPSRPSRGTASTWGSAWRRSSACSCSSRPSRRRRRHTPCATAVGRRPPARAPPATGAPWGHWWRSPVRRGPPVREPVAAGGRRRVGIVVVAAVAAVVGAYALANWALPHHLASGVVVRGLVVGALNA